MQTEQELLNEIARVAGLINRKKQEQTRSTSTSKEFTQPPVAKAVVPPKTGRNLSYVRPGAEKPHTTQISNPRKSAPKIPTNLANTNIATTPNVQNNNPNQVTPILKYSKVVTPAARPISKYQLMMQNIRKAQVRQMKAQVARRTSSMSLVIKNGVAYKKSHNQLIRVDESNANNSNNNQPAKKPSWRRNSLKGLLNIGENTYKKTRTKLIRVVDKPNEENKQNLKNILKRKRVSLGGFDYAIKRTSLRLLSPKKKSKQLCLFYTKFGKCNQGDKCPFVHDPEKVATCRNFLKGKCNDPNCLLRHKIDRDQMPVCYHFLRGNCTNENCPYSHVKVNRNAEVCPDFLKGYCPRGSSCKLKHTDICEEFLETGTCKNGDKCKLRHVKKKKRKADEMSNDDEEAQNIADSDEERETKEKEKKIDRPTKRIRPNFE